MEARVQQQQQQQQQQLRRRAMRQRGVVDADVNVNASDLNLDESDDENVSEHRLVADAAMADATDTDSALSDDEDDDDASHAANAAGGGGGTPRRALPKAPSRIAGLLERLSPRWRNWVVRGFSGTMLISGFSFLVYMGASGLLFLTYLVVTSSYSEVMRLAFKVTGAPKSIYKNFVWTLYFVTQYWLAAPAALSHLSTLSPRLASTLPFLTDVLLSSLLRHHQLVCFAAYVACIMWFVLLLDEHYIKSYALFAWCHTFFILICVPGHMMNESTFNGLIWYVLPMSLITLNDIAAFYVGFFAGKTPLIKLSPKKTWEGFIGGAVLTVSLGAVLCHLLSSSPGLVCPVAAHDPVDFLAGKTSLLEVVPDCRLQEMFRQQQIKILGLFSFTTCPFVVTHGIVISLICSLVGPFAGFFASGFKRGCKRKNFGGFIPGHGGVTDRCDCMFLCAAIINVYYNAFIATAA